MGNTKDNPRPGNFNFTESEMGIYAQGFADGADVNQTQCPDTPHAAKLQSLVSRSLTRRSLPALAATGIITLSAGAGAIIGRSSSSVADLLKIGPPTSKKASTMVDRIPVYTDIIGEIPTSFGNVEHHNWNIKIDQARNETHSKSFKPRTLTYTLASKNGDTVFSEVAFLNGDTILKQQANHDLDWHNKPSIQLNVYPKQPIENIVLRIVEASDKSAIFSDESIGFIVKSYTHTPLDSDDHPRVFSEVDLDNIYPDRKILQDAHALVKRFAAILPDVTVFLLDNDGSTPVSFFNKETGEIFLSLQHFTKPQYEKQGEIALFHLLSYAFEETATRNNSEALVKTANLESFLQKTLEDKKIAMPSGLIQVDGGPNLNTLFQGLDPKHFQPAIANDLSFPFLTLTPYDEHQFVDALAALGNFANEFTHQFAIEDHNNPLFLSPEDRQRTLLASEQIFLILDTFFPITTTWNDAIREIIPIYDNLRSFVFSQEVSTS